jgi:nickel-dependent lactate racemase
VSYRVGFGDGHTPPFDLPPAWRVDEVATPAGRPAADGDALVRQAMQAPLGPALQQLARGRCRVVIAITDLTRPCPDHLLVPALLAALTDAGVPLEAVELLVATGLHRPMTDPEIRRRLGPRVPLQVRLANHDARAQADLVELEPLDGAEDGLSGGWPVRVPAVVNRRLVDADLVLATGMVEPHLYAGFSGGAKVASIGCAGEETIATTHGPRFLDHPGTRLGLLDGNPFARAVSRLGQRAGVRFVLDVVLDDQDRIVDAAAGDPDAVLALLAHRARDTMLMPVETTYDVAIAGVPHPKDSNFYQASRVPTYLQLGPRPLVRPGGAIILAARCPEGLGSGLGESRFADDLAAMEDPAAYVAARRDHPFRGGEQRAYVMAKVLRDTRVILVGAGPLPLGPVDQAPTIEEALRRTGLPAGQECRALVVPDAFRRLPVPG